MLRVVQDSAVQLSWQLSVSVQLTELRIRVLKSPSIPAGYVARQLLDVIGMTVMRFRRNSKLRKVWWREGNFPSSAAVETKRKKNKQIRSTLTIRVRTMTLRFGPINTHAVL